MTCGFSAEQTKAPQVYENPRRQTIRYAVLSVLLCRLFFVSRSLLCKLGFLVRRQMTNNNLTFRGHSDLQINRDLTVQPYGHSVLTNAFQRLSQVNAMTIDLVAAFPQSLSNVHR